jgi:phosphatidylinositol alpha-1,6-mannosyltransferase
MTTVQLVSKPVAPPWNDATKVLVQGILSNRASCAYRFFGTPSSRVLAGPHVRCAVVSRAHKFQPSTSDHLRTLLRLIGSRSGVDVYHCLFTPNPRTSLTLKLVLRAMGRPVMHTLCSSPRDWADVVRLLFADRVVTVSDWAKRSLEELGVQNVSHIPPGIAMPKASDVAIAKLRQQLDLTADRPCLLFPGDYEYSAAHPVILRALPEIVRNNPEAVVVFACRTKTPQALAVETAVRKEAEEAGLLPHVRFLREVNDFESLLALATVVLFPVQSLYRKMDVPVTLLQALALCRPIITSTLAPLRELLVEPVGIGVAPGDAGALASAVSKLLADPDRRAAMGRAGRELVTERYSAMRMARAYENLYLSLSSRHKPTT